MEVLWTRALHFLYMFIGGTGPESSTLMSDGTTPVIASQTYPSFMGEIWDWALYFEPTQVLLGVGILMVVLAVGLTLFGVVKALLPG